MSSQDTDPWELTWNKEVQFTVAVQLVSDSSTQQITSGGLQTALRAQNPILDATQPFNVRYIAAKAWGNPGGGIAMQPHSLTNLSYNRGQRFDVGDGVRRPTVDYSWNNVDMTETYNETPSGTFNIITYAVTPGASGISTAAIMYIKMAIRSNAFVPIATPPAIENNRIEQAVRDVKKRTMPLFNE